MLLVLVHHAKVPPFQGGYLGVDIFFVISGFLITSLVARAVQGGTFSFRDFYWRRARRLLPAAYVTILACVLLSPFLLTDLEMGDFVEQVFGAVTFTANIVLWLQTGYFERAAELKPLLHMWSLSIEEQYYLILPAALVFAPRRFWLRGAAALTILSFLACFIALPYKPGAVFYLLPTRAWEMGLGSVLAIWSVGRTPSPAQLSIPSLIALLVIGWLWFAPISRVHPGFDAALACAATVILLAQPLSLLSSGVAARILAWVGDRSYSLYLVHWPIFVFLNSANVSGLSIDARVQLGGVLLSIALASLLYWAVEERFRSRGRSTPRMLGLRTLLLCSALLCLTAASLSLWSQPHTDLPNRLRTNFGLSGACDYRGTFSATAECRTSGDARTLVWGDSFAMHLVPGLVASSKLGVVQATSSMCAPLSGLAAFVPPEHGEVWGKACMVFNHSVLQSLSGDLALVEVVVLSSPWDYLLNAQLQFEDGRIVESNVDAVAEGLQRSIATLRAKGKRAVIVGPPPSPGFDAGRCNARLSTGRWSFWGSPNCEFFYDQSLTRQSQVRTLLERVSRDADISVIYMDSVMCNATENSCSTRLGSTFLYSDSGHLSYEGSVAVAERAGLARLVQSQAR